MDKIFDGRKPLEQLLRSVPEVRHLRVHTCANLQVPPEWRIERRFIRDFHLLFVRGGKGRYWVNGYELEMRRGIVVFVGGGAWYSAEQDYGDPPWIIPVRFGAYDNATGEQVAGLEEPIYYGYETGNVEAFEFMFRELYRLCNESRSSGLVGNVSSLLHTIWDRSCSEVTGLIDQTSPRDWRLEKVRRWMDEHPLDRSTVLALARRAGISPKYFSTLFRLHYGMSPKNYQVRGRLNYGRFLLQESSCSVKETAARLDYPDPYVFSKQFKSIFGYPPEHVKNS